MPVRPTCPQPLMKTCHQPEAPASIAGLWNHWCGLRTDQVSLDNYPHLRRRSGHRAHLARRNRIGSFPTKTVAVAIIHRNHLPGRWCEHYPASAPLQWYLRTRRWYLAALYGGEDINGDWTLRVTDNFRRRPRNPDTFCINFEPLVNTIDFTCADLGLNEIEVTATDDAGNSSSCIATVEVRDVTDPILVCQDRPSSRRERYGWDQPRRPSGNGPVHLRGHGDR